MHRWRRPPSRAAKRGQYNEINDLNSNGFADQGLRPLDPRRRAAAVASAARRESSVRSSETWDLAAHSQRTPGSEPMMGSGAYGPAWSRAEPLAWPSYCPNFAAHSNQHGGGTPPMPDNRQFCLAQRPADRVNADTFALGTVPAPRAAGRRGAGPHALSLARSHEPHLDHRHRAVHAAGAARRSHARLRHRPGRRLEKPRSRARRPGERHARLAGLFDRLPVQPDAGAARRPADHAAGAAQCLWRHRPYRLFRPDGSRRAESRGNAAGLRRQRCRRLRRRPDRQDPRHARGRHNRRPREMPPHHRGPGFRRGRRLSRRGLARAVGRRHAERHRCRFRECRRPDHGRPSCAA